MERRIESVTGKQIERFQGGEEGILRETGKTFLEGWKAFIERVGCCGQRRGCHEDAGRQTKVAHAGGNKVNQKREHFYEKGRSTFAGLSEGWLLPTRTVDQRR